MRIILVIIVVALWIAKNAKPSKATEKKRKTGGLPQQVAPVRQTARPAKPAVPIVEAAAERRAQMRDSIQWHEAKRQQDDAEQLHSIKMDTCESKLESLRVLYEAGILDREEYAQRVARVKSKHYGG